MFAVPSTLFRYTFQIGIIYDLFKSYICKVCKLAVSHCKLIVSNCQLIVSYFKLVVSNCKLVNKLKDKFIFKKRRAIINFTFTAKREHHHFYSEEIKYYKETKGWMQEKSEIYLWKERGNNKFHFYSD